MQIGSLSLSNNLILAPMAGISDLPFRQLCRSMGAGLAVSEMVAANTALWGSNKSLRRLDFGGEPGPIAVQIVGADPRQMAEAARYHADQGAALIDINMGCPAPKVCRREAGAALLRDEPLATRIMRAVVAAVPLPVTVKLRTGWDPSQRNAPRLARIAEAEGIQALTLHGRTRACGYSGHAESDTLRQIKEQVTIPLIANGDIDSPHKAQQVLRESGADGLMIGRAARGNPWIFPHIHHYLEHGTLLPPPTPAQISTLLRHHLEAIYRFYGEHSGVRIARKHIAWYSTGQEGSTAFRQTINHSSSAVEQLRLVENYFAEQEDQAA